MNIIDPLEHPRLVKRSLQKFSHFVEHNFEHYLCTAASDNTLAFFDFGKGRGALASHNQKNKWSVFPNGIIAPMDERWKLLEKLLNHLLLHKKAKKVVIEADERFCKEIREHLLESKKLKVLHINFLLHWPVFHMELFDSKMKGRKWKKMRNIHELIFG